MVLNSASLGKTRDQMISYFFIIRKIQIKIKIFLILLAVWHEVKHFLSLIF